METLDTIYKSSLYGIPAIFLLFVPSFFLPMLFNYFMDLLIIAGSLSMMPRSIQYIKLRSDEDNTFEENETNPDAVTDATLSMPIATISIK